METSFSHSTSTSEIWDDITSCTDMPSPPGIAVQLINMAQSDDTDFEQVEKIVKLDPVIAAKLLRLSNSSFYSRGREIENLRQAIGQFGLNGTLIIALTFSLIKTPKKKEPGLDINRYWLHSLASGIICKKLSRLCNGDAHETFYLAGLLQNIGILAIAKVKPELYQADCETPLSHQSEINGERHAIGIDHSEVGSWLLEQWEFPHLYVEATRTSHNLESSTETTDESLLSKCVAISGHLADLWCLPSAELPAELGPLIEDQLQLDDNSIQTLLSEVHTEISEVAQLFELTEINEASINKLLSQAKECLTLRSLLTEQKLTTNNTRINNLEVRTSQLEHKLDYDELTGVHNRAFAYKMLSHEFPISTDQGRPIALVFIDLDDFKQVNDTFGHSAGDKVLRLAAEILKASARKGDIVARVGGEEFLVVMLDTGFDMASSICERLVREISKSDINIDESREVHITASVGLAVHGENTYFTDVHELIDTADMACYKAKTDGKNRWIYKAA